MPTTSRHGAEVRRRQPTSTSMPHSRRDRRLVSLRPPLCRYSRRGAGLRCPVGTCLTPPRYCAANPWYFPPLQDPRRAWATTLGHSTTLDRGKTSVFSTLDALPHLTQGTAHSAVTATPSIGTTGRGHALNTGEGLARTTTISDAILHGAQRQQQPLFSPGSEGEG